MGEWIPVDEMLDRASAGAEPPQPWERTAPSSQEASVTPEKRARMREGQRRRFERERNA